MKMDKEQLRKLIPYVLIVIAVGMSIYSYMALDSASDKCNEHWEPQIEEYKLQVEKKCVMLETVFVPYDLDSIEIE